MNTNKIGIALAGGIFAGVAGLLIHGEFKNDGYSFLDHVDMDEVSGRNLTEEELSERFKRGTDADIAELEKPIILGTEPNSDINQP